MIKAVILDVFDTVLVTQARRDLANPYAVILNGLGYDDTAAILRRVRRHVLEQPTDFVSFTDAFAPPHLSAQQRAALVQQAHDCVGVYHGLYRPRPETVTFLQMLHETGVAICLGSNVASPFVPVIESQLSIVPHRVYSCDVGKSKPDAAFFRRCCDEMGVSPRHTVMIGNSFNSDMHGAASAQLAAGYWMRSFDDATSPAAQKIDDMPVHTVRRLTDVFPL